MQREAIIVWHNYTDGKLTGYSITHFTGNDEQLLDCLKNDVSGERRNKVSVEGTFNILQQVILLQ